MNGLRNGEYFGEINQLIHLEGLRISDTGFM